MIDYQAFLNFLETLHQQREDDNLQPLIALLPQQIQRGLDEKRYGDLPRWKRILEQLPPWPVGSVHLDQACVRVSSTSPLTTDQHQQLTSLLKGLHPWRKGPFELFDVLIDTEWRSDWKWARLEPYIDPLEGRNVLDVGCGSGYHCWRMRGQRANLVMGIDPTPLFIVQFFALQHYIQDPQVAVLPMGIEHLPNNMQFFDSIFSMGVLYHRRSPFDHLIKLRDSLRSGGQLILETLVIDGEQGQVLVPEGRYSRMGNVWFLPSCQTLSVWLKKSGFIDVTLVDVTATSTDEQRSTEWMTFYSLKDFLDPDDNSKTIEGYPAPKRAIFTAKTK